MFAVVSPAKKLTFTDNLYDAPSSQPVFKDEIKALAAILKTKSAADLMGMMSISEKLGELNYQRYQNFSDSFDADTARHAIYMFQGDTYVGLKADTFSKDDLDYAQDHFGILSGLYGLLRPLDLIQPYRLEMGTKLQNDRGEDLYDFWGDAVTRQVEGSIKGHEGPYVVNLASNEYNKVLDHKYFGDRLITCHFKENKDGKLKTIGLFAKRARGMMARFMIQNRIESPEGLKDFSEDGYMFSPENSSETELTFIRSR